MQVEKSGRRHVHPADASDRARQYLDDHCPYAGCFRDIRCNLHDGILRVDGSVPSFYLKQILQTFLRRLEGVEQIDNRVNVVNSQGLSSVKPK